MTDITLPQSGALVLFQPTASMGTVTSLSLESLAEFLTLLSMALSTLPTSDPGIAGNPYLNGGTFFAVSKGT